MKIEYKDGPAITSLPNAQPSARERAISKLMQGSASQNQAQQAPVANPTQISAEDLSALKTTQNNSTEEKKVESAPTEVAQAEEKSEKAASEDQSKSKSDPLSAQYAQLARKEKALRAKIMAEQNAMKAKEEALRQREEALKAKEAEYQSNYIPKSRLKSETLNVLGEVGVSYDELTQAILNPQAQQDPRVVAELERLKAEVQAQKQAQEEAKKAFEAQKQREYQQAVQEIRREAQQLVKVDPAFETIRETDSIGDVVELIEKTYHKDGILLTVEEAAREVEDYLVEQATKIARLKKIQERIKPASQPSVAKSTQEATTQPKPEQSQQPTLKTLTNAQNASRPMTARERAIAAFNKQLK